MNASPTHVRTEVRVKIRRTDTCASVRPVTAETTVRPVGVALMLPYMQCYKLNIHAVTTACHILGIDYSCQTE